jgi:hypothetical protein
VAIATVADYQAATKQRLLYSKGSASWGGSGLWYSNVLIGGATPAAASPANTTSGIVPTDALTGYPPIGASANTLYITGIEASLLSSDSTFRGFRFLLADLLWYGGTYTPNATVNLSAQPSFASRLPGGSYVGTQLWLEGNHGSQTSGSSNYVVTYTNQSGTTGRTTPSTSPDFTGSNVGLEAVQFSLAAGDTGIQKIESVVGSGAGQRNVNLMILRPLAYGRVDWTRTGVARRYWIDRHCMPQVFADSALITIVSVDFIGGSALTAPFELQIEIAGFAATTSGVTWDPATKWTTTVLSNGNLTATETSTGGFMSSTTTKATGKVYFEILCVTVSAKQQTIKGISQSPNSQSNDYTYYTNASQLNGAGPTVPATNPVNGDVINYAIDFTSHQIWIGRNGVYYDHGGGTTGNPSAGTNATFTGMASGNYYAGAFGLGAGHTLTGRFDPSSWSYPAPTGFEPWT